MGRAGRSSGGGSRSSGSSGGSRSRSSSRSSHSSRSSRSSVSFSSHRHSSSSGWDDDDDVVYEPKPIDPATYHIMTEQEFLNNKKRNKQFRLLVYLVAYLYFNGQTLFNLIFRFDIMYLGEDIASLIVGHIVFVLSVIFLRFGVFRSTHNKGTYEDYMNSDIVRKAKFQQAFDDIEQWHEKESKEE